MMQNRSGYSLTELVLAMAILLVLIGLTTTFYRPFYLRNELDVATHSVVLELYRAQSLSRDGAQDSAWGVHVTGTSATVFRGTSYSSRTVTDDETYIMPSIVSVTGTTDYVFAKTTGLPLATGSTTLSVAGAGSKQLVLNAKGMVNY